MLCDVLGSNNTKIDKLSHPILKEYVTKFGINCLSNNELCWNNEEGFVNFKKYKYDTENKKIINNILNSFDYLYNKFLIDENIYFDFHANYLTHYLYPLPNTIAAQYHSYLKYVKKIRNQNFLYDDTQNYGYKSHILNASIMLDIDINLYSNIYDNHLFILQFENKINKRQKIIFILKNIKRHNDKILFDGKDILYYASFEDVVYNYYNTVKEERKVNWISGDLLQNNTFKIYLSDVGFINILKPTSKNDIEKLFNVITIDSKYIYSGSSADFYNKSNETIPKQPAFFALTPDGAGSNSGQAFCMVYEVRKPIDNIVDLNQCNIFNGIYAYDIKNNNLMGYSSDLVINNSLSPNQSNSMLRDINKKYTCQIEEYDISKCGENNIDRYTNRRILQELFFGIGDNDSRKLMDIYSYVNSDTNNKYDQMILYNEQPNKAPFLLTARDVDGMLLRILNFNGFKSNDYGGRPNCELMLTHPHKYLRFKKGFEGKQCYINVITSLKNQTEDIKGLEIETLVSNKHVSVVNKYINDNIKLLATNGDNFDVIDPIFNFVKLYHDQEQHKLVKFCENKKMYKYIAKIIESYNLIAQEFILKLSNTNAIQAFIRYQANSRTLNGEYLKNDNILNHNLSFTAQSSTDIDIIEKEFVKSPTDLLCFRYLTEYEPMLDHITNSVSINQINPLNVGDVIWYPHIISTTLDPELSGYGKDQKNLMMIRVPKNYPIIPFNIMNGNGISNNGQNITNIVFEINVNRYVTKDQNIYYIDLNNQKNDIKLLKMYSDYIFVIYNKNNKNETYAYNINNDRLIINNFNENENTDYHIKIIIRQNIHHEKLLPTTGEFECDLLNPSNINKYKIYAEYVDVNQGHGFIGVDIELIPNTNNKYKYNLQLAPNMVGGYNIYMVANIIKDINTMFIYRQYEILLKGCMGFKCVNTTKYLTRDGKYNLIECVPYVPYYKYYKPLVVSNSRRYNINLKYFYHSKNYNSNNIDDVILQKQFDYINSKYQIPALPFSATNLLGIMSELYHEPKIFDNPVSYEMYLINSCLFKTDLHDNTIDQKQILLDGIKNVQHIIPNCYILLDIDNTLVTVNNGISCRININDLIQNAKNNDEFLFKYLKQFGDTIKKNNSQIDFSASDFIKSYNEINKDESYSDIFDKLDMPYDYDYINEILHLIITDYIIQSQKLIVTDNTKTALNLLHEMKRFTIIPFTSNHNFYDDNKNIFINVLNELIKDTNITFKTDLTDIIPNYDKKYDNKQILLNDIISKLKTTTNLNELHFIYVDDKIENLNMITEYINYDPLFNNIKHNFHPLPINNHNFKQLPTNNYTMNISSFDNFGISDVIRIINTFVPKENMKFYNTNTTLNYDDNLFQIQSKLFKKLGVENIDFENHDFIDDTKNIENLERRTKGNYNLQCLDPLLQFN